MQMSVEATRCDPDCDTHLPTANLRVFDQIADDEVDNNFSDAGTLSLATNDSASIPVGKAPLEADAPTFDPDALRALLHDQMEKAYQGNRMVLDFDVALVREITETVRKLSRFGAHHVLDAGLSASIETAATLALRLQAAMTWYQGRVDETVDGGRNACNILNLPPEIRDLLPSMTDLSHLMIRLCDSYTKFRHVNAMTERLK